MKRLGILLGIVLLPVTFFAFNLKQYDFNSDMKPSASPVYRYGQQFSALLFDNFSAAMAILNGAPQEQVEILFNNGLKKHLTRYNVTIYEFSLPNSIKIAKDIKNQTGTLNVEGVNQSVVTAYDINKTQAANAVLTGDIEYFRFNENFGKSYIVINLKLYNRDNGQVYWLSSVQGKVSHVIDYIALVLTHPPVNQGDDVKKEVENEIASQLPIVTFKVNPATIAVKDETKMPQVMLQVDVESRYEIISWTMNVMNAAGTQVKKFDGTGMPPKNVKWDMLDDSGKPVALDTTYKVVVSVTDELGNKISQPAELTVTKSVEGN
ncbi:MAG: hypothetical protein A2014_08975 [Spirochaetes bacterium GWF1_49_6]|nr:MAG: hypothetical protein A2014_08975 [Spirochaetes bacterium GWF1_49_6]